MGHAKAGRIRVLALTSASRWSAMPDLPTFKELGIEGFEVLNVTGLVASGGPRP